MLLLVVGVRVRGRRRIRDMSHEAVCLMQRAQVSVNGFVLLRVDVPLLQGRLCGGDAVELAANMLHHRAQDALMESVNA